MIAKDETHEAKLRERLADLERRACEELSSPNRSERYLEDLNTSIAMINAELTPKALARARRRA